MGLHEGHRQRMYEKLKKNAMEEHEWLEMLLFMSVPRRNTNDLSHRLIQRFGSVEEVLKASLEELQTVEGVGIQIAAHLKCIEHLHCGGLRILPENPLQNAPLRDYGHLFVGSCRLHNPKGELYHGGIVEGVGVSHHHFEGASYKELERGCGGA